MEIIPPYLASTVWLQTIPPSPSRDARLVRPRITIKTRDYTRTLIESNNAEGMVLTVPVVGGSSSAKRLKPIDLRISDHGDWTRIHLGAIEAAYGREPYFQHFFPEIASIIDQYPQQLALLNVSLMDRMMKFVDYAETIGEIRKLTEINPARCNQIKNRIESKIDPTHSFLEPIFRLGPDSIFLL